MPQCLIRLKIVDMLLKFGGLLQKFLGFFV